MYTYAYTVYFHLFMYLCTHVDMPSYTDRHAKIYYRNSYAYVHTERHWDTVDQHTYIPDLHWQSCHPLTHYIHMHLCINMCIHTTMPWLLTCMCAHTDIYMDMHSYTFTQICTYTKEKHPSLCLKLTGLWRSLRTGLEVVCRLQEGGKWLRVAVAAIQY